MHMRYDCAFHDPETGECIETYYQHIKTGLDIFQKYLDKFYKYSESKFSKLFQHNINSGMTFSKKDLEKMFDFIMKFSFIFHDAGKLCELYRKHRQEYRHELFSVVILNKLYKESNLYELIDYPLEGVDFDYINQDLVRGVVGTLIFYHHEYILTGNYPTMYFDDEEFGNILNNASKVIANRTVVFDLRPINKLLGEYFNGFKLQKDILHLSSITKESLNFIKPFKITSYDKMAKISKLFNVLVFLDNMSAYINRKNKKHPKIFNEFSYNKLFYKILISEL